MDNQNKTPILQVRNLCKHFRISKKAVLKAVDGVSFDIYEGETVGLVGESGCGKSTAGKCLVRLYEPTSGEVIYKGKDITKLKGTEKKDFCKEVQMIFQNPYSSLNPRMTVKEIVGEGIKVHNPGITDAELEAKVLELLEKVGLNKDHMSRFSHEFSGGQRQRIGIARALAVDPKFIVCDEPISALDVSIQAQVLNMLRELQKEYGLTYLFVAHDLSVVKFISDRVIVMYLGTIVEYADAEELYANPMHPYTKVLLSSIPEADPKIAKSSKRLTVKGEIPSPINPKPCCRFAERCPDATEECFKSMPELKDLGNGHMIACHLYK